MTVIFNEYIELAPVAKARPRVTRRNTYTPEKTKLFEAGVINLVRRAYKSGPVSNPLAVTINLYLPRPKKPSSHYPIVRPDIDNYAKAIMDACNHILWVDDSQIITLHSSKRYDYEGSPGFQLYVETIE